MMAQADTGAAGNACAGISDQDRMKLRDAATQFLAARGFGIKILNMVGRNVEGFAIRMAKRLGGDWSERIDALAADALWGLLSLSTGGMRGRSSAPPTAGYYRMAAAGSGAVTGFMGGPAAFADIPLTTAVIFRSIASIAQAHGEDIGDFDTRRACLEVFAFGGTKDEIDDVDISYWSVRGSLSHASVGYFMKSIASRWSLLASQQAVSTMIPLAGAVTGAGVNYLFADYFQKMAEVHFTLREVERRFGDAEAVRACFDRLVADMRKRRRLR
jgi:hypothetical protein